jgi:N,N'-diacetyllegionaminate synthase
MAEVIAEFCQNYNGDRAILKKMIWAAAEAGANYAKIQTIYAEDVAFRERFEKGLVENGETKVIKRPYNREVERLKKLELPSKYYPWFIEECEKAGIKPLTTVFSRNRIEEVAQFGWKSVKVASYDCASAPFLKELSSAFDHLVVSTGATYPDEIKEASEILKETSFTFLQCVTVYPTPLNMLQLIKMKNLRKYTDSVGFSDHTLVARDGLKASAVALLLGADIVERHFTILDADKTKDGPVSINQQQLKTLCKLASASQEEIAKFVDEKVGDYAEMLGSADGKLSDIEILNRDYFRGRFASHSMDNQPVFNWEEKPL